jgi:signal transduction histidine kinase
MYADLLEHDLQTMDSDDARARSHLVVITGESSRLSRLINNVLTFSHLNRDATQAKSQPGYVDKIIEAVVEQFHPSLEKLGIEVALDLDADQQVALDVDGLEQMLGNLISNVEKYAAEGKHIRIASRFKRGISTIDVSDAGPGITPEFAKRIFQPFERALDHIEAATGTGIGLAITRGLARRAGGDLVLRESALGACFRLSLVTPLWRVPQ